MIGEIPLAYKLQIFGAEEVKRKLQEIDEQMERGTLSKEDATKEYKNLGRQSRDVANSWRIERNILLATHPQLNKLTRGLSLVSSVSRTALAISNALNLMWLRQGQSSSELREIQHELAGAQRDYNRAVTEGDLEAQADAMERIGIATAKISELNAGDIGQQLTDIFTTAATIASGVSTTLLAVTKNPKVVSAIFLVGSKLGGLFGGIFTGASSFVMGVGTWLSTALLRQTKSGVFYKGAATAGTLYGAIFAGAAAAALILLPTIFADQIRNFIRDDLGLEFGESEASKKAGPPAMDFGEIQKSITNFNLDSFINSFKPLTDLLTGQLPEANKKLEESNTELWTGMIGVNQQGANIVQTGFNSLNKGINDSINQLIKNYNRIAKKTGKSTLSLGNFSPAPAITFGGIQKAARGFSGMVNSPTLFLAGEAGSEMVNIMPTGGGKGGGSIIINNYIYGSVLAEREVAKIANDSLKEGLKRRGVTGF